MNKSAKRSHSRETADSHRGEAGAIGSNTNSGGGANTAGSGAASSELPLSAKGLSLTEVELFVARSMKIFHSLAELSDLKTLYELGKQLSRLYFDCAELRAQISARLIQVDFPDFVVRVMKKLNNLGIFKHDDIWFSSFYFYNICWNFSECSFEFASALASAGLPSLLVMNILHKPYLDNLSSRNIYFLIKASLSIMHNLCRYPGNRYLFKTDKVKETLIDFTGREEELIRVISILCLAFLLEEEEAAALTRQNGGGFLLGFIDVVTKAKLHDRGRFMGFATWELLQALAVFTGNDSVKRDFVECRGVGLLLDIMAKASNSEELHECLAVLWNLCFDPEIRAGVLIKQHSVLTLVEAYVDHEAEEVRACAAGIKWLLEDQTSRTTRLLSTGDSAVVLQPPGTTGFHLFVCHAEQDRESVYRIADRLKRAGLSAVLPRHSSLDPALKSLEARYRGVVQSALFLLVLSEASKSSQQCRAETQYAAFLKKPIIPVIVQSKFKAAGWMEKFVDKVFFDFGGKRDFETTMENLKNTLVNECCNNGGGAGGGGGNNDDLKSVHSAKSVTGATNVHTSRLNLGHSTDSASFRHHHHGSSGGGGGSGGTHQFNHSASLDSTTAATAAAASGINSGGGGQMEPHSTSGTGGCLQRSGTSAGATPEPAGCTPHHCLPELIQLHQHQQHHQQQHHLSAVVQSVTNLEFVKKWTKEEVADWLVNSDLAHLRLKLAQFNGAMLASLLEIKREAPEYFYKCLEDKMQLHFMDTLALIAALHKLVN